ncbi:rhamnulokinase [Paenibacillus radicis (ex Xue et al. 2023)]|uniref:Rhamnulokinase n=1 Tax=Paenibacillus radicis (ex Xue et al. 2023) TaxID=2972489 RepID=A0ABT1YLG8_9BACL|nr:rhamnulokinase family protein [Paenibacillus radicis (ex Xue et al. 2023)]MCR8634038.1 rhamnulokinase [Paenibacillus radicis (ex Xue et al. 2023)]
MVSRSSNDAATVLAFDLGASSGRAVIGKLEPLRDGEDRAGAPRRLTVEEIHRFPNDPVQVGKHLHWDILRLLHEIKQGIVKAGHAGHHAVESLAIDSWAVDFGLLDASGQLLGNPYHYRDHHTEGMMEEVETLISREELFDSTGIQFLPFNTIYQLYALKKNESLQLQQADKLLMIPDLLRYFLTGIMLSEGTNASTTQLLNARTGKWDSLLLEQLRLPASILLPPVAAGTSAGSLSAEVCAELGVPAIPVIAVGEHDTASAVAAVPASEEHFAYLSCGTWSLLGTEVKEPVLTKQALDWNFTNEGGVNGTFRLLRNIMGLWLVQECKRAWDKAGLGLTFPQLVELADQAKPFAAFIDPDDAAFLNPVHMPEQIQAYCSRTGQYVPQTPGEIIRIVLESLSLQYRVVLERTESLVGKERFNGLHMVGGGINNRLLCQFTANAIGRPVWAGPVEGSAIGNLVVQYMALGHISGIQEARDIIRHSFPVDTYQPEQNEDWEQAFLTFQKVIGS